MKSIFATSPALLLAAGLLSAPALAQTMSQPSTDQPMAQPYAAPPYTSQSAWQSDTGRQMSQSAMPQGPYRDTCKDARMLGNTLTAFCPKGDGTWHTVQLGETDQCTGGVQIVGGELSCNRVPEVGSSTPPQNYGSAYGTSAPPPAPGYAPAYAPAAGQAYPPPAYSGYPAGTPYATQEEYHQPSASKTARPAYGY